MVCSLPGSSVCGILQARILEWSGLPCFPQGDLPDPGIKPESSVANALQVNYLLLIYQGSPVFGDLYFSWVQSFSCVFLFATPWTAACQAPLSITNSQSLFKPMSIKSVMPSNHLNLCRPLLLLPSIFPSIRVFPMSQFFTSGGQSIGASASASVLLMNIQDWFPLGWTSLISLQSKGLSGIFSITIVQKHQFSGTQLSLWSSSHVIHDHWKNHSLD